jgi:hypothetical protein
LGADDLWNVVFEDICTHWCDVLQEHHAMHIKLL